MVIDKYVVFNQSSSILQLMVPVNNGINMIPIELRPSMAVDILPYVGSIDGCMKYAHLRDLEHRGIIRIVRD